MQGAVREALNGLHTWAGVIVGGVLFAIFWMGSLSVFDREIDRWMAPVLRLAPAHQEVHLEALTPFYEAAVAGKASAWTISFPTERYPVFVVSWRVGQKAIQRWIDPTTGAALPDPGTLGATRFIYPFHYMLHIGIWDLGYWIVGFAGMTMMVLCVSGIVIHRRILADFFVLRASGNARRLVLDLHNIAGAVGLPFHFMISFTGLIIFFAMYIPGAWTFAYDGNRSAYLADAYGTVPPHRKGQVGSVVRLEEIVRDARMLWRDVPLRYLVVRNPGDAGSTVQIGRADKGVGKNYDVAYFDATTGALIAQRSDVLSVMALQQILAGMHYVQFRHWSLRWAYFLLGLLGCLLIATGFFFWLQSRRRKHVRLGLPGVHLVESLAVGSVTGIVVATFALFVTNRLLPLDVTFAGYDRATLEISTFYFVWLVAFMHAWRRSAKAWAEQGLAIGLLAVAAAILNWLTTGDHILHAIQHRHLWPIAGMDVLLLSAGGVALLGVFKIRSGPESPKLAR